MLNAALVMALLLGETAQAPPAPSVAVLHVSGKGTARNDQLALMSDALTASVTSSKRFSRVTSSRQLEQALGVEQQRQLMDCGSESCIAELAGALGVDFILSCSLGRLGELWIVNLTLVAARTGTVVAAVSNKLDGDELDVVVRALDVMVDELLDEANVPRGDGARVMRGKAKVRRDLEDEDAPRRRHRKSVEREPGIMDRAWKVTGLTAAALTGGTVGCGVLSFAALGLWLAGFPAQPIILKQFGGGDVFSPANQAANAWNCCLGPLAVCMCGLPVPFLCVGGAIGWVTTVTLWIFAGSSSRDDEDVEED